MTRSAPSQSCHRCPTSPLLRWCRQSICETYSCDCFFFFFINSKQQHCIVSSPHLSVPVFQGACITRPAFHVFRLLLLLLRPEISPLPKAFFLPGLSVLLLRTIPRSTQPLLFMFLENRCFLLYFSPPDHLNNILQQKLLHWEGKTRDVDHWAPVCRVLQQLRIKLGDFL